MGNYIPHLSLTSCDKANVGLLLVPTKKPSAFCQCRLPQRILQPYLCL